MKILTVFGTRPEAIKVAPVLLAFNAKYPEVKSVACITGQHREMCAQVLEFFGVAPDYNLDIMQPAQTLNSIWIRVLQSLDQLIVQVQPDMVLVQGDTSSAAAAALCAFHRKIPVGHIEAGLRSFNPLSPFPEEVNRRIIASAATLHFPPTDAARENLIREQPNLREIPVVGNTVIDALLLAQQKVLVNVPKLPAEVRRAVLDPYILVTAHRRENHGAKLRAIGEALVHIATTRPDISIIVPLHPNPAVQEALGSLLASVPNICVCQPLDYPQFVYLLSKSLFVLTDSGGVQEEAPSLGKPVLVLRDNTERPEGVAAGNARLVGCDKRAIISAVNDLLCSGEEYGRMTAVANPYGDGRSGMRIAAACVQFLGASS